MTLNERAASLVERLLARPEDRRIAVHPIEGGGRYIDCGIEAGADCSRASNWLGSAWRTWPRWRSCRARWRGGRSRWFRSSPITRSGPAWPASTRAGPSRMGSSSRWARARCARRPAPRRSTTSIGFRETARRRRRRARDPQAADSRGRRRRSRRPAGSSPRPSRCSSHRRPAWPAAFRSWPGRSRPPCTSWPSSSSTCLAIVSAHGTAPLPPVAANDLAAIGRTNDAILYGARVILASPATTPASSRSVPRFRRRPRAITASRSRRSSRGTTTTSTRSIRTCSAPPRSSSRTSRPAECHAFGQLEPDVLARSFLL